MPFALSWQEAEMFNVSEIDSLVDPEPTLEQLQELDDLIDEMPIHQVEELLSSCGSKWVDTFTFWAATRSRMDDLLDSLHETASQETT
jgi:hypothetical protein